MKYIRLTFFYVVPYFFMQNIFEVIYEYHFGIVTNSDALYPYLFAKDLWTIGIAGWNVPPSTSFFPDIILSILVYPLASSTFRFYLILGLFFYLLPGLLSSKFGLYKSLGPLVSFVFLLLAAEFPSTIGQFYLPGFHTSVFYLFFLSLSILDKKEISSTKLSVYLILLFSFAFASEQLFFVQTATVLIPIYIQRFKKNTKLLAFIPLGICIGTFALFKLCEFFGLGVTSVLQFSPFSNIMNAINLEGLERIWNLWKQEWIQTEFRFWFILYLILFSILIIFRRSFTEWKEYNRFVLLCLSPIVTLFLLSIYSLSFNQRYLYFLVWIPVFFSFFILQALRFKKSTIVLVFLLFCIGYFWSFKESQKILIQKGKLKREGRMRCFSTWDLNAEIASSYWPVKYLKVFSPVPVRIVPVSESGIYHHWIHNRTWDSKVFQKPLREYQFALVDVPTFHKYESILTSLGFSSQRDCLDWKILQKQ